MSDDNNKELFYILETPSHHKIAVYNYDPKNGIKSIGRIFFFHGVAGSAEVWKEQINYFVENSWSVVALDYIGHGNSDKIYPSDEFEFVKIAEDALFVFDNNLVSVMNVLVGHSYGCSVATYIASKRMNKIYRMVLISGGGPEPLGEVDYIFNCCDCFLLCCHSQIMKIFKTKSFKSAQVKAVSNDNKDKAVNVDSRVLAAVMRGQKWEDGGEQLHEQLRIPVLLLRGSDDCLVNEEDEYEMLYVLPFAQFKSIPNAGHMVMLEQPEHVSIAISSHISSDWSTELVKLRSHRFLPSRSSSNDQNKTFRRRKSSSLFLTQHLKRHYPPSSSNCHDNKAFSESQRSHTMPYVFSNSIRPSSQLKSHQQTTSQPDKKVKHCSFNEKLMSFSKSLSPKERIEPM